MHNSEEPKTKGHNLKDFNISLLFIDTFLKQSLPVHQKTLKCTENHAKQSNLQKNVVV